MVCERCASLLGEITFQEALARRRKKFLRRFTQQRDIRKIDPPTQYVIASYFGNHSLFLFFDLNKNLMKYGPRRERFFVQPIHMTFVFNLPWFFFNVLYSNYFHFYYNNFCPRCYCKCAKGRHSLQECDYNIIYFQVLRDVLNGSILRTRHVYEKFSEEDRSHQRKNPYSDLSFRPMKAEIFFDILSISLSVLLWIYLAVYVSFPMVKVLMQKLEFYDAYEWSLF